MQMWQYYSYQNITSNVSVILVCVMLYRFHKYHELLKYMIINKLVNIVTDMHLVLKFLRNALEKHNVNILSAAEKLRLSISFHY
ncbi:hypothetical protein BGZ65_005342 [Modicella reniformis]|uniref:Uncharacterized protein n=1 Tax=Modicella reniformis TaxID=1440133 RepID=A0A9P6IKI0_9FUNG|nr:hypothetical protein BGZ65_005342 [Modicella reniformis]